MTPKESTPELENTEETTNKKSIDFEEPSSVTWFKKQYTRFQALTAKEVSDNIWLIGLKLLLKGIMILILIILSPFILLILGFTLLAAG